jgi:hydrogenase nickel incorporation protein HypA/HybF
MHEMSIAQNILEIVREHVPEEDTSNVRSVKIRIGELAGVVHNSLAFCFSTLVSGTPLQKATLDILSIPVTAQCNICAKESRLEYGVFVCPLCNSFDIRIITGSELNVVEIELED